MKDDTIQPTRISKEEYVKFKQFVQDIHGTTRGHLKTEIENALREYRQPESQRDALARIEDDVATIKATLAEAEADGGSVIDTSQAEPHTHAPSRLDTTEKPAANAATDKKVAYLAECVLDAEVPNSREIVTVPRSNLIDVVKDEYGFRSDTAKRYVERLVEHFDLRAHPTADGILVTPSKYDDLIEQRKDELREEANDAL